MGYIKVIKGYDYTQKVQYRDKPPVPLAVADLQATQPTDALAAGTY